MNTAQVIAFGSYSLEEARVDNLAYRREIRARARELTQLRAAERMNLMHECLEAGSTDAAVDIRWEFEQIERCIQRWERRGRLHVLSRNAIGAAIEPTVVPPPDELLVLVESLADHCVHLYLAGHLPGDRKGEP